MAKKQIISTQQAVIMTGKSERRIQVACRSGEIRAEKIGRSWHIEKTSVNEFIRKLAKAERERVKKAKAAAKRREQEGHDQGGDSQIHGKKSRAE